MLVETLVSLLLLPPKVVDNAEIYEQNITVSIEEANDILEELIRLEEEEKARQQAEYEAKLIEEENNKYTHTNYRQTFYSVQEGETKVGAGFSYNDSKVKSINNVMHFYDNEYGYLPIVAIDYNKVMSSGLNSKGTPNIYGSVIELKYPNGNKSNAIVLDACGACMKSKKIDLWVYSNDYKLDVANVSFRILRNSWN